MIEQGFNYADTTVKEMIDFFETGIENPNPSYDWIKSSMSSKKKKERKFSNKRKQDGYNSSIGDSSEESSVDYKPARKYCIQNKKCCHTTNN